MSILFLRRAFILGLLLVLLPGCQAPARPPVPAGPVAEVLPEGRLDAAPAASSPVVEQTPVPSPTPPPTLAPTATPVPTPGPPRVGLQVGHWRSDELPDELSSHRANTGAASGPYKELDLNLAIASLVKERLEAAGVQVDLLPATVPIQYEADAFVAIHADGSTSPAARGWKLSTFWRASPASMQLAQHLAASYVQLGLPRDPRVTSNMRGYYALNYRRHRHAVAPTTPSLILELGFLTNAQDRAVLLNDQNRVADAVASGILSYLAQRPAAGSAELQPPNFSPIRTRDPVAVYEAPDAAARQLSSLPAGQRLFPFEQRDGWFKVPLPPNYDQTGWVRADMVETAPPPTQLPDR